MNMTRETPKLVSWLQFQDHNPLLRWKEQGHCHGIKQQRHILSKRPGENVQRPTTAMIGNHPSVKCHQAPTTPETKEENGIRDKTPLEPRQEGTPAQTLGF